MNSSSDNKFSASENDIKSCFVIAKDATESIKLESFQLSNLLKTTVTEEDQEIPLVNVDSKTLTKIIEFMNHYEKEPFPKVPKPIRSKNMKDLVPNWYAEFMDTQKEEEVFELTNAANYMDIQPLMNLGAIKIATWLKGKSPSEIRAALGIKNDFTEEEKKRIREENKWVRVDT